MKFCLFTYIRNIVEKITGNGKFQHSKYNPNYSYSQCGEDIIVNRILGRLKIPNPTYLDIGASHPIQLNNTYKCYEQATTGVLVEPEPTLFCGLRKVRPKDTILNIGIGIDEREYADFYIMTNQFLSTFSKESAENIMGYGKNKIEKVIQIPLANINTIIAKYFHPCPNFISIDVEGLDFEILKKLNFSRYTPEVFCLETISYTENNTEQKITEIIDFMVSHGYMVYGDTYINTIFVDKTKWRNR